MPLLPPRIKSDVWKTIKNFHNHNAMQMEDERRKELGLNPEEPLPALPYMEYPKTMYSPDYFASTEADDQVNHYQTVHSKEQEDALAGDGWFASLSEAKKSFYASKEQQPKKK
jgi:S-adenosylmethionine:tRNA-ribosyltransferase-isomerase (queuine synthetase)